MSMTEPRRPKPPARKRAGEASATTAGAARSTEVSGRQRLIEAAEMEFGQKGYDGASVLSIANRAGVKQPLLNYHFGGKEGLWRAVVESAYTEPLKASTLASEALDDADPLTRLRATLRVFAVNNIRHPAAHALVVMEVAQASPRLDWLVENYMKPFHDKLDALIADCHAAGLLKPYPREHASIMMTGMLTAIQSATHLAKRVYGVGPMTAEQTERHAEQAIDALLNGMLVRRDHRDSGKKRG